MPSSCRITIDDPQGMSPLSGNQQPGALKIWGRVSNDCDQLKVSVSLGPGDPPLLDEIVAVPVTDTGDPGNPNDDVIWETHLVIDPASPVHLLLTCNRILWIRAECTHNALCMTQGAHKIRCKDVPDDGRPECIPNPWAAVLGQSFTYFLLLSLLSLAAWGTFTRPNNYLVLTGAFFVIAGMAYGGWILPLFCIPHRCAKRGAVLWALKWACAGALMMSVAGMFFLGLETSLPGFLFAVAYGILTSWLIYLMERDGCPIPSGLTPLNQLRFW